MRKVLLALALLWGAAAFAAQDLTIGTVRYSETSPAQIAADADNYSIGEYSLFRVSTDATRSLTGMTGGRAGRVVTFKNVGSFSLQFADQSASSTAGNRFICPGGATYVLAAGNSVTLYYDGTTKRWRVGDNVVGGGSPVGGSGTVQYLAKFTASSILGNSALESIDANTVALSSNTAHLQAGALNDLGWARNAAGVWQATNGSTGTGSIMAAKTVIPATVTITPSGTAGDHTWAGGYITFKVTSSTTAMVPTVMRVVSAGATPAGYNGTFRVYDIVDLTHFRVALAGDPGACTVAPTSITHAPAVEDASGVAHFSGTSDPTGALSGDTNWRTDLKQLKEFDGTNWNPLTIQSSPVYVSCWMTPPSSVGQGTTTIFQSLSTWSTGGVRYNNSDANGDNYTYTVTLPKGTYRLDVVGHKSTNMAIVETDVDGVDLGDQDMYNAGGIVEFLWTPSTTLSLAAGSHTVTFKANDKNAGSSDYFVFVCAFQLTRTGD